MKFQFVDDIENWKKWWSLRWIIASAFFSAVVVAYATLPADWLPVIPQGAKQFLAVGALLSAGVAGITRVVKQHSLEEKK